MRGILVATAAVFLAAAPSARALDYVSQFRSVAATASAGRDDGLTDHKESSALGPWGNFASTGILYVDDQGIVIGILKGSADQISDLAIQQVSMSGSLDATVLGGCSASGRSELSIEFSVDTPSPYFSTLSTTGATHTSIDASAGWNPTGSGTLAPGTYSLSVVFDLAAGGGSSSSGTYMYSLSLIPEPSSICLLLGGLLLITAQRIRS